MDRGAADIFSQCVAGFEEAGEVRFDFNIENLVLRAMSVFNGFAIINRKQPNKKFEVWSA
jgi:frataxin-like iron-binding protein CyaY